MNQQQQASEPNSPQTAARRERRLPATGLPVKGESRRTSSVVSLVIHLLIIFLVTADFATHTGIVKEIEQGAGGPGPAGGGGGGHRGSGGVKEHVQYVQAAPPPAPTPQAVIPPPKPMPQPVVPPPVKPPVMPEVKPEIKPADLKMDIKPAEAIAPMPGTGGGTGSDGTNGSGPGTGGGVGTGIGTGRGSGVGPGTGGGRQINYAPTAIELFIPPLPFPGKLRGFHMVAEFDVDSTGAVLDYTFTSTGDGGYDKRLKEVLKSTKFRPGTSPEGKPIRMKAQIIYDF